MEIRDVTLEEWEQLLPNSGFDAFHAPEALSVVDRYADGDLQLLCGFRGEQPVGLFPAFVRDRWPVRIVLSPPPGLAIPYLGPLVMQTSPKQRKREKLNERFSEAVLEAVGADERRTLFGMGSSPTYTDPRPYAWAGLGVVPRFSYVLDLDGRAAEDVLASFTSDLRSEIRKGEDLDLSTEIEGPEEAKLVCRDLEERYVEQGLSYPTPESFSADVVSALGNRARVYVARTPEGKYLGGITVLYSNEKAIFWQGGSKANYENVSVNSLLHWEVIEDILDDPELDSVDRYDLGAVTNRRISRFKSKFNPELVQYYEVKSTAISIAKRAYSIRRHAAGRVQSMTRGR